jgi:hypothetical protein
VPEQRRQLPERPEEAAGLRPGVGVGRLHLGLANVSYTNVQIAGGGDVASIPGTFSRTFFNV